MTEFDKVETQEVGRGANNRGGELPCPPEDRSGR